MTWKRWLAVEKENVIADSIEAVEYGKFVHIIGM